MQHDAWFVIGIFVFIFLIWIATGGPTHPISFEGPALEQPQELGGGDYLALPRAPFGVGSTYISLPGSSSGGSTYETGMPALPLFVNGIAFGNPSPFRGRVSLAHYVTNASSTEVRSEYVEVSVPHGGAPVNITGWRLVSEVTGKAGTIPKGAAVPQAGKLNTVNDIVLQPGERAYIISGISPIGVSFRENKCIGYLNTFQTFTPSLPQSCPAPRDELVRFYGPSYIRDTVCVDYVSSLWSCQAVPFPPRKFDGKLLSETCRDFVTERLTYNGCVAAHYNDPDFHGSIWHIYLGRNRNQHLWRSHNEIVKLLDAEYKTVDAFSY